MTTATRRGVELLVAVAASLLVVLVSMPFALQSAVLLVALACWIRVTIGELRAPTLAAGFVAAVVFVALAVCVIGPPRTSRDVWSYSMYGRIAVEHHDDPYVAVPSDFPDDPFLGRIGPRWRSTPPVYGPVFLVVAEGISRIARDSPLVSRVLFQIVAAGSAGMALLLMLRRSRAPGPLVLFGVGPVLLVSTVNGAHVDAWMLPLILGAFIAAERRHWARAGFALAIAALIKITVLVVVLGACVWLLFEGARRAAIVLGGVAGATVGAGYLVTSRHAFSGLSANASLLSRASVWALPRWIVSTFTSAHLDAPLAKLASASVVLVTVWACAYLIRRPGVRTASSVPAAMLTGAVMLVVLGAYVLPWYAAPTLLLAAGVADDRWVPLVIVQSSCVFAAYLVAPSPFGRLHSPHPFKWFELLMAATVLATAVWTFRKWWLDGALREAALASSA